VTAQPKSTILVVDDERESRDFSGDLLAHAGHNVLFASTGAEALRAVDRYNVDLIVMDMIMPVMDGLAAIRKLKAGDGTSRIPVLAITGDPGSLLESDARAAGCDAYIVKPVDPSAFISLVGHWLRR
jgi:CheY-like chemotaxis protein